MATIDEIFDAMAASEDVTHEYLVIDPDTRQIMVPEIEKTFGASGDGIAERKYFKCPRYVGDDLDLAAMFLTVYFRNAAGEADGWPVDDVAVDGDDVYFSWLLSEKVTAYQGAVSFGVCADLPDTAEKKRPDWNTTMATGNVLEGPHPDTVLPVEESTSDVVARLREMVEAQTAAVQAEGAAQLEAIETTGTEQVDAVNDTAAMEKAAAIAAIQAQGEATKASIPADYTALANTVDRLTRDRAAAIVCEAQGAAIQVHDASNDPLQGLRIFGKTEQVKTTGANLLPITDAATKTDRGLTQTVIGGVCTVRGTANSTAAFNLTLYGSYYNTEPVFTLQPGTYTVRDCMVVSSDGTTQIKYENTTFTLTEALGVTWVATRSYQVGEVVAEVTHPMLNTGDTALTWEPYSGGVASPCPAWPRELQSAAAPVVNVCGKNLIPNIVSKTAGSVTFTANADGSFTVNGTADAYRNCDSEPVDATPYRGKTVTLSGKREFSANLALQIYSKCASGNVFNSITRGKVNTFKIPDDAITITLQCYITNGKTADNVVIYPQLELGSEETDFEPYAAQTLTLTTPEGLPGIPVSSGGNYTDETGQQWVADEVDLARGVYVQRVGVKKLTGAETFEDYIADNGAVTLYTSHKDESDIICTHAVRGAGVYWANTSRIAFRVIHWGVSTLAEFKNLVVTNYNAGTPVVVHYMLKEPVETALTDAELQTFRALHSNKHTTTLLNDAGAHMIAEYAADPKLYIDRRIAELIEN